MDYSVVKARKLAGILVVGIFSLGLAGSVLAQGAPAGMGAPANNSPKSADRERQVDQSKLRTAELNAVVDDQNQKRLQAAIGNMREDFMKIQIVRNNIAKGLVARKPLDYTVVSDQTAEISKRANRLNFYMRAVAPDDEKPNDATELKSEEMVGALVKLCKLIDSFTENPVLKNAATVDSKDVTNTRENRTKADADLLAIIKLSERILKMSNSLKDPK